MCNIESASINNHTYLLSSADNSKRSLFPNKNSTFSSCHKALQFSAQELAHALNSQTPGHYDDCQVQSTATLDISNKQKTKPFIKQAGVESN